MTTAIVTAAASLLSEDDAEYRTLEDKLPQLWAALPASSDGEEAAFAFIRAAYARGYSAGLATRLQEARTL